MDKRNTSMQKLFGNDIRRCFQNPGLNKFAKSAFSFLILVTFCTMLLEIMMPENIKNRLHKRHNLKMEKRWNRYMTKHSKILNELMKADVQLSNIQKKGIWQDGVELTGELKKRVPSCLIIGVMKGGTYALRTFLTLHPRIVAYDGEIKYFSQKFDKGLAWYKSKMPPSYANQITIEKSLYFSAEKSVQRIKEVNKNMKLLVIVRDPVERAISHFIHMKSIGLIENTASFHEILTKNESKYLRILSAGRYVEHLQKWTKHFPLNQIHFVDGNAFVEDPIPELSKVEDFLELEHKITKNKLYYDKEKGFYCFIVNKQRTCLPDGKGRHHPSVEEHTIRTLEIYYHPLNQQFFSATGKKFQWKYEQDYEDTLKNIKTFKNNNKTHIHSD